MKINTDHFSLYFQVNIQIYMHKADVIQGKQIANYFSPGYGLWLDNRHFAISKQLILKEEKKREKVETNPRFFYLAMPFTVFLIIKRTSPDMNNWLRRVNGNFIRKWYCWSKSDSIMSTKLGLFKNVLRNYSGMLNTNGIMRLIWTGYK